MANQKQPGDLEVGEIWYILGESKCDGDGVVTELSDVTFFRRKIDAERYARNLMEQRRLTSADQNVDLDYYSMIFSRPIYSFYNIT